jgi:hypothetical protein
MEGAGPVLFVTAVAWRIRLRKGEKERAEGWSKRRLVALVAAVTGVLGLPLLQTYTMLLSEPTLSESSGIERTVLGKFPRLMEALLERTGGAALSLPPEENREVAIRSLSIEIMKRGLLKRDLVLTGSRLGVSATDLPGDLYFYVPSSPDGPRPEFGARGINLREHPALLLDVMMGSGAIYPVFPARALPDLLPGGGRLPIVDGSYSHRSPIEAAVRWGATHIILIEASPEQLLATGSFGANIAVSLTHLYDQAQLLDMHSKDQVVTLTLFPQPPQIGLLDFSPDFIATAIEKGYHETRSANGASFVKEPSVPRFFSP